MRRFSSLGPEMRVLVALSVLCDGAESVDIVSIDRRLGTELAEAARELLLFEPEVRLTVVATELREALASLIAR